MPESEAPRVREIAFARVYRLGEEPPDDLSATTTAAQRIEMVSELSRRAWELTGKPWPQLPRAAWPVTIVRAR